MRFEIDGDIGRGVASDYQGSDYWLDLSPEGTLFYGRLSESPLSPRSRQVQREARERIRRLPRPLSRLLRPVPRGSLGWTFAMWSSGPYEPWQDLTGRDPDCWESVAKPETEVTRCLLGGRDGIRDHAVTAMGRPDLARDAQQIALFVPLTKERALRMMRPPADPKLREYWMQAGRATPSLAFARRAAARAGYPVTF
jgi:hypothetical protein